MNSSVAWGSNPRCKIKWLDGLDGGNPKLVVTHNGFTYVHCHPRDAKGDSCQSVNRCNAFLFMIMKDSLHLDSPISKVCSELVQEHETSVEDTRTTPDTLRKKIFIRKHWKEEGQPKFKFTFKGVTYVHNHPTEKMCKDHSSCLSFNVQIATQCGFSPAVRKCLDEIRGEPSFGHFWKRFFGIEEDEQLQEIVIRGQQKKREEEAALYNLSGGLPPNYHPVSQGDHNQQVSQYDESQRQQGQQYDPESYTPPTKQYFPELQSLMQQNAPESHSPQRQQHYPVSHTPQEQQYTPEWQSLQDQQYSSASESPQSKKHYPGLYSPQVQQYYTDPYSPQVQQYYTDPYSPQVQQYAPKSQREQGQFHTPESQEIYSESEIQQIFSESETQQVLQYIELQSPQVQEHNAKPHSRYYVLPDHITEKGI